MISLHRLNPFSSLFGRIFVWFCLASGLMIIASLILIREVTSQIEITAPTPLQFELAERYEEKLAGLASLDQSVNRSIRRLSDRGRRLIVSIDATNDTFDLSFPRPMLPHVERLIDYTSSDSLLAIKTRNVRFLGPFLLQVSGQQRTVFIGRFLPREERPDNTVAFVYGGLIALVMGIIFCGVLVWFLTRPMKQISQASQAFALGDLGIRVLGYERRKDEIGALSKDFNDMAEKIQRMVESQRMLMANVSHELRTPLTRMQLALALMESDAQGSATLQTNAHRIETDITKMDHMIDQILNIARAESKHLDVNIETLLLENVVSAVVDASMLEANNSNIKVSTQLINNVICQGNPNALTSAIENILRNALKYATSEVLITLEVKEHGKTSVAVLTLEDDGEGVDDSHYANLFEPFYRVSQHDKSGPKGAGLGLAIAKASIQANRGSIRALKSALGGLKVVIQIPLNVSSGYETI